MGPTSVVPPMDQMVANTNAQSTNAAWSFTATATGSARNSSIRHSTKGLTLVLFSAQRKHFVIHPYITSLESDDTLGGVSDRNFSG